MEKVVRQHCLLLQKSNVYIKFMDYELSSGNAKFIFKLGSTLELYRSGVTCLVPRPDIFVSVTFSRPFVCEMSRKTMNRGLSQDYTGNRHHDVTTFYPTSCNATIFQVITVNSFR